MAVKVFDFHKVKSIHSNYDEVISLIRDDEHKAALLLKAGNFGLGYRYEMMFPNFMRLSQHDKSSMRNYRINVYGLISLST